MYDMNPLIEALDNRLLYLLGKCPPEEYNPDEVKALINLMKEYTPDRCKPPTHIRYGNSEPKVIHISESENQDRNVIMGLIAVITCIVVLILVAFYGLNPKKK